MKLRLEPITDFIRMMFYGKSKETICSTIGLFFIYLILGLASIPFIIGVEAHWAVAIFIVFIICSVLLTLAAIGWGIYKLILKTSEIFYDGYS